MQARNAAMKKTNASVTITQADGYGPSRPIIELWYIDLPSLLVCFESQVKDFCLVGIDNNIF